MEIEINQEEGRGDSPQEAKNKQAPSGEGAATLGWKPFLLAFAPRFCLVSFGSLLGGEIMRVCARSRVCSCFQEGIESSLAAVLRLLLQVWLPARPAVALFAFSSPLFFYVIVPICATVTGSPSFHRSTAREMHGATRRHEHTKDLKIRSPRLGSTVAVNME
jgi:hypothetical protein